MSDDHYRVHVSYSMEPMDRLRNEYEFYKVWNHFDGLSWERHSSCKDIDTLDGEREFFLAEVPREFAGKLIRESEDALAEYFDLLGYRFAIEVEGVAFWKAHPEVDGGSHMIALGSSVRDSPDGRMVACLYEYDTNVQGRWCSVRELGGHLVSNSLCPNGNDKILLVRK